MNAIRKTNLMRAAISAIIFIIIIAAEDFFGHKLDPFWIYLVESLVFFLIYYALECTILHPKNQTEEERQAQDLAIIESLKKQTKPFRANNDDTNNLTVNE